VTETIVQERVAKAVKHFWDTRTSQGRKQGTRTGRKDHGNRTDATGGKQLDGFVDLFKQLLKEAGLPREAVFHSGRADLTLPGFFRPTKQWDLLVVAKGQLLAAVECKSLCGPSFGNNYNNRVEEAIGTATDLWTAYREGAFDTSPKPVLGYFLLLEEADSSTRPVVVKDRHFSVSEVFQEASYAKRCEETVRRLVRERCYDTAAFILSSRVTGKRGHYDEPASDLAFNRMAKLLCNQTRALYKSI
jgi:Restriction endonuclease XhoI